MLIPPTAETINFVSWTKFNLDIVDWERRLPYFDAVCGVPTSGLYPAAYIAMQRNIHLLDLSQLLNNGESSGLINSRPREIWLQSEDFRFNSRKPLKCHKILIVDDSTTSTAQTMNEIRRCLQSSDLEICYGAVYKESGNSVVDYSYAQIDQVRIFEWNWRKHWILRNSLIDIDGVLCEDWQGLEGEDDNRYYQHLIEARILYKPLVKVKALVTNRLEKYRSATVHWLAEHNIEYDHLYMYQAESAQERRSNNDHASVKAAIYSSINARLFVESDQRQAMIIRHTTNKPVLCIETMKIY